MQSDKNNRPAPTMPNAKIELYDTSGSLSCENLPSVSKIFSCGLDAEMRARASGTALLMTGSP